jgi:phosphoribosylformylglycinamidine synthase PurS subunit
MAIYKFGVRVMPRPEVLDTQGRAVEETLKREGRKVQAVRVGRFVELEVQAGDEAQATQEAQTIAESLLCNSLIETFAIEKRG